MPYVPTDVVEVRAWDLTVGAVARDPATGYYAFEFEPGWLATRRDLSPIVMPSRPGVFVFADLDPQTYHRLPPMLADSLPDRFGNALVNAWMAEQGITAAQVTPLDRLAYAADRAMGALEFRPPAVEPPSAPTAVQLADLVTAARAAVSGDLDAAPRDALHELIQVGTSAGGARAKAVVAFNPATGQIRSGQIDAPAGFEQWIIKLDGVSGDPTRDTDPFADGESYGRIEYAYARMAAQAGIEMTECRLLPEGPRTHFMTRRFDRDAARGRIHVQTLCGIAGLDFNLVGAHSYAQYLEVIDALGLGPAAREQAFRRIVFNVAAMNRDDHTKNLAFLMSVDGEWSLAPAYDVTHAHNPSGTWTSRHQMSINGQFEHITLDDLDTVGDRFAVPGYRGIAREVPVVVARWPEFAAEAGVDQAHTDRIAEDLATHTLA
ncbi:MAG: type II toxin-antitoxin system HipA family toxin [Acidimicrobiia bacterium]|jgi:serine/threonine-protein kinase HipA